MSEKNDKNFIPKLELEKFTFSPPGPMGWSFSEYEKILDDPEAIQDKQTTGLDNLKEISNVQIIQYPTTSNLSQSYNIKENKITSVEHDEKSLNLIKEEEGLELTKEVADHEESSEEFLDENLNDEESAIEEIPLPRVKIIIEERSKTTPFLTHVINKN